jgi:hypothetical protein
MCFGGGFDFESPEWGDLPELYGGDSSGSSPRLADKPQRVVRGGTARSLLNPVKGIK